MDAGTRMSSVLRGRCSVKAAVGCGNRRDRLYTTEVVTDSYAKRVLNFLEIQGFVKLNA
jgi:hypothetical protein